MMRRARLSKNTDGSYDLTFTHITAPEAGRLMQSVNGNMANDLSTQLFDEDGKGAIIHLRNPIVIGSIE